MPRPAASNPYEIGLVDPVAPVRSRSSGRRSGAGGRCRAWDASESSLLCCSSCEGPAGSLPRCVWHKVVKTALTPRKPPSFCATWRSHPRIIHPRMCLQSCICHPTPDPARERVRGNEGLSESGDNCFQGNYLSCLTDHMKSDCFEEFNIIIYITVGEKN